VLLRAFTLTPGASCLAQVGGYAEITLRELRRWTPHLLLAHTLQPATAAMQQHHLAQGAYVIYAARFRTPQDRASIVQLIDTHLGCPLQPFDVVDTWAIHTLPTEDSMPSPDAFAPPVAKVLQLDGSQVAAAGASAPQEHVPPELLHWCSECGMPREWMAAAMQVHTAAVQLLSSREFIGSHGMYRITASWLTAWLAAATAAGDSVDQFATFVATGALLYGQRLRHASAREQLQGTFWQAAGLREEQVAAAVEEASELQLLDYADAADMPFAVMPSTLRTWKVVGHVLEAGESPLVVGSAGCGKSEALMALGYAAGASVLQHALTPGEAPRLS
jgi:hypothetical protein